MCSTPGGVIGIGTVRRDSLPNNATVLNAWRRHWNRHAVVDSPSRVRPCAQRLAASLESAHDPVEPCDTSFVCSTPGGVIGIGTLELAGRAGAAGCSTPGGVIGIGTRLGTSKSACRQECSTPGGVIGIGTACTWLQSAARCGAQRLAASLESARAGFMRPGLSSCAQRLAASLESAPGGS